MKRTIYYLILMVFALFSCDPMADINKELEDTFSDYQGTFSYTLTSDDYADIADMALDKNPGDTLNAAFISSNEYFTDDVPASAYIPLLIPELYPALGKESSGLITYNYSGSLPEDLTMYTTADMYEVGEEEYTSVDEVVDYAGYLSPSYPPEVYIPAILSAGMDSAESGDILLVEYLYSDVDPKIDMESTSDVEVAYEGFTEEANGLGSYTATSLVGDQEWVWNSFGDGNAKMSGFSGGAQDNDDWLVSGSIDLTGLSQATLHVTQAINYLNDMWDQINISVSTDYNGSDIGSATWDTVALNARPPGNNWDFVTSFADLSGWAGETIFLGFQYLSDTGNAATWEVADVTVTTPGTVAVIGKDPMTYRAYYEFDGNDWMKMEGVYYVNAVDYNAMGSPGTYDNFSGSDKPANYIPNLLSDKYPLAGQDQEVVVVYKYYAGWTMTLASTYTYNMGSWESGYDYVAPTTAQFLYGGSGWVFDPTITFTMVSSDFQIIVDYVGANVSSDYVDGFGTGETYYGAGAYYVNFDIRPGYFESDVFDSWEDCVADAIGNVLLPAKYPNATTQVNGVDMFYVVNFATYSGAAGNYSIKFQVTKSAPGPEFTLVEGPY